jgi:hypothetical protein
MTTTPGTNSGTPYTASGGTAPAPVEKASLFEDFIDIFYTPSTVFARREKASFWPYLLIITLISAIFVFASRAIYQAIFEAEFARNMASTIAKNPQVTEEAFSRGRGVAEAITSVMMYLGMPLLIFFVGVFVWLAAKMVSAKIDFGQALLIGALAQIPRLIGALLTTVQGILMADTSTIRSMHGVGYSPARFIDPDSMKPALLGLIARFDLFTLWVTFLVGIGIAVIAKVPRGKGFAAAVIVWLIPTLWTAVSLLWT